MKPAVITGIYWTSIPSIAWPSIACVLLFLAIWAIFYRSTRGSDFFFFDAQDFYHYGKRGGRRLPMSAPVSTFAPLLENYINVTKLLITVAAASIAFGGSQAPKIGVSTAKIILAFSILYGVGFAAVLQFRYEVYIQNLQSYSRRWYSLVQALGFSCLICFAAGYLVWALTLAKI
jgi:hypothetical protein